MVKIVDFLFCKFLNKMWIFIVYKLFVVVFVVVRSNYLEILFLWILIES